MHLKSICKPLLFLALTGSLAIRPGSASAQAVTQAEKRVTGRVTDENGAPLQNVSVAVKGTSKGTVTDSTGTFVLNTRPGATIVISILNYTPQELKVGATSEFDVQMAPDKNSKDLGEVVVVGYGTQRKVDLTGAVGSISRRDISSRPLISPDEGIVRENFRCPDLQSQRRSRRTDRSPHPWRRYYRK